MPDPTCEKPASVGAEPASKIERLGGAFDLINSIFPSPSQAPASRCLVGARAAGFAEISPSAAPADPENLISAMLALGITVARVVGAVQR
jgi:hypothetical protein